MMFAPCNPKWFLQGRDRSSILVNPWDAHKKNPLFANPEFMWSTFLLLNLCPIVRVAPNVICLGLIKFSQVACCIMHLTMKRDRHVLRVLSPSYMPGFFIYIFFFHCLEKLHGLSKIVCIFLTCGWSAPAILEEQVWLIFVKQHNEEDDLRITPHTNVSISCACQIITILILYGG